MSAFGRILSGRFGSGIRSEEGRSGEAASCSYHIIMWYLEELFRRNYVLAKIW